MDLCGAVPRVTRRSEVLFMRFLISHLEDMPRELCAESFSTHQEYSPFGGFGQDW
jgi:hypothetical protein